jgi:hypothetical protein
MTTKLEAMQLAHQRLMRLHNALNIASQKYCEEFKLNLDDPSGYEVIQELAKQIRLGTEYLKPWPSGSVPEMKVAEELQTLLTGTRLNVHLPAQPGGKPCTCGNADGLKGHHPACPHYTELT